MLQHTNAATTICQPIPLPSAPLIRCFSCVITIEFVVWSLSSLPSSKKLHLPDNSATTITCSAGSDKNALSHLHLKLPNRRRKRRQQMLSVPMKTMMMGGLVNHHLRRKGTIDRPNRNLPRLLSHFSADLPRGCPVPEKHLAGASMICFTAARKSTPISLMSLKKS